MYVNRRKEGASLSRNEIMEKAKAQARLTKSTEHRRGNERNGITCERISVVVWITKKNPAACPWRTCWIELTTINEQPIGTKSWMHEGKGCFACVFAAERQRYFGKCL